jgi:hypothetical protein
MAAIAADAVIRLKCRSKRKRKGRPQHAFAERRLVSPAHLDFELVGREETRRFFLKNEVFECVLGNELHPDVGRRHLELAPDQSLKLGDRLLHIADPEGRAQARTGQARVDDVWERGCDPRRAIPDSANRSRNAAIGASCRLT